MCGNKVDLLFCKVLFGGIDNNKKYTFSFKTILIINNIWILSVLSNMDKKFNI